MLLNLLRSEDYIHTPVIQLPGSYSRVKGKEAPERDILICHACGWVGGYGPPFLMPWLEFQRWNPIPTFAPTLSHLPPTHPHLL